MTTVFNAGRPNATVSEDVRFDTIGALDERIAELRDLLAGGDLSGAARAEAAVTYDRLTAARNAVMGYTATVEEIDDALGAIGRADAVTGMDADDLFGMPLDARPPRLDAGRWLVGQGSVRIEDIVGDGAALRTLFENDPQAFAAQWRNLSAEDRQLALFSLQQEVAMDNQITQMLTGLMKSGHETAMAVARNLQV